MRLLVWYAQREGIASALRKVVSTLIPGAARPSSDLPSRSSPADQNKNLQPGEWVEVKSKEEILQTLDQHGKNYGLRFVPEMYDFCGQRLRVLKRVEKICIENTPEVRRIRNTVILEGGICQGGGIGCDRACYHFWREVWLRRRAS
jgi:hypothetical protein